MLIAERSCSISAFNCACSCSSLQVMHSRGEVRRIWHLVNVLSFFCLLFLFPTSLSLFYDCSCSVPLPRFSFVCSSVNLLDFAPFPSFELLCCCSTVMYCGISLVLPRHPSCRCSLSLQVTRAPVKSPENSLTMILPIKLLEISVRCSSSIGEQSPLNISTRISSQVHPI